MTAGRRYEIRVAGSLDRRWWGWFEGYTITAEPSVETILSGEIRDYRTLLGALVTLHELGHELVSIVRGGDCSVGAHPGLASDGSASSGGFDSRPVPPSLE